MSEVIIPIPLEYFQDLLESDKSTLFIKEFVSDFFANSGEYILDSDVSKGVIKCHGQIFNDEGVPSGGGDIIYDFADSFMSEIKKQSVKSKDVINTAIHQLTLQERSYSEFLLLQKNILENLLKKADLFYKAYPFVNEALVELLSFVNTFNNTSVNFSYQSYNWDSDDEEMKLKSITELHRFLQIDYKLIDSNLSEFINAFTNKEIKEGIKWLDKGRNMLTNKQTLIYLINELQKQNFIDDIGFNHDFNKRIEYVFRDSNGNQFKNIRQSKSNTPGTSKTIAVIDLILSQLL